MARDGERANLGLGSIDVTNPFGQPSALVEDTDSPR